MSNFVTLLVVDDAFQREALADLLKDEGFEVMECTTAEAAELIIRVNRHRITGAHHRPQSGGCDVGRPARSIYPPPPPAA
jgi:CheY-like chemotaxis protein